MHFALLRLVVRRHWIARAAVSRTQPAIPITCTNQQIRMSLQMVLNSIELASRVQRRGAALAINGNAIDQIALDLVWGDAAWQTCKLQSLSSLGLCVCELQTCQQGYRSEQNASISGAQRGGLGGVCFSAEGPKGDLCRSLLEQQKVWRVSGARCAPPSPAGPRNERAATSSGAGKLPHAKNINSSPHKRVGREGVWSTSSTSEHLKAELRLCFFFLPPSRRREREKKKPFLPPLLPLCSDRAAVHAHRSRGAGVHQALPPRRGGRQAQPQAAVRLQHGSQHARWPQRSQHPGVASRMRGCEPGAQARLLLEVGPQRVLSICLRLCRVRHHAL